MIDPILKLVEKMTDQEVLEFSEIIQSEKVEEVLKAWIGIHDGLDNVDGQNGKFKVSTNRGESAIITVNKNKWFDFSCNEGNVGAVSVLRHVSGLNEMEALRWIMSNVSGQTLALKEMLILNEDLVDLKTEKLNRRKL